MHDHHTDLYLPDKGQVTVRYSGQFANAHRSTVRKAGLAAAPLRTVEEELQCAIPLLKYLI